MKSYIINKLIVEGHGTGTPVGDPIEARAIGRSIAKKRSKNADPLLIGSVKSNIGHLEGAAGVASVIKLVSSLSNKIIPSNMHFNKTNNYIPANTFNLKINNEHASIPENIT